MLHTFSRLGPPDNPKCDRHKLQLLLPIYYQLVAKYTLVQYMYMYMYD